MTDITDTLRRVLRATPAHGKTPAGPNRIGTKAWGVTRHYAACSAPYARPAGSALARLKKLGLVMRDMSDPLTRWTRTPAGDREVAAVGVEVLVTRYTSGGILLGGPTHWMPLPAAPEAP